jgi:hypothetical protein
MAKPPQFDERDDAVTQQTLGPSRQRPMNVATQS